MLKREGLIILLIDLTSDMKTVYLSVTLLEQKILIVSEGKLYREKQHFCKYKCN